MQRGDALDDVAFEAWLSAQAPAPDVQLKPDQLESIVPPLLRPPTHSRASQVTLLPSQTAHVQRLNSIFDRFPFAMDLSMLGAGKTFTATHVAITRRYKHVIVVCPVSVMPKWKWMHNEYNFPLRQVLGYQSLRSVRFKQPKHGLLFRRDSTFEEAFEPTSAFRKMVEEGLLLVFDEVQNIKNVSSQFRAAQALIHAVTLAHGGPVLSATPPFRSHVLLLSASPIDKIEQAIHIFRALGVMTDDRIAQQNIQTGMLEWRGMQQIRNFCRRLDPEKVGQTDSTIYSLPVLAYTLFQSPFKVHMSSAMPAPKLTCKLFKRNAFYVIDAEGEAIVKRGLSNLTTAAQWDGTRVNFVPSNTVAQMASVMRSLQIIETGKIATFARVADEHLKTNPQAKCVIAVNFTETVDDLERVLSHHAPLRLTGSTSEAQRGKLLELFQFHDTRHRLLICNQSVASTGIDLDDKHGSFPRLALVSPNYSTITSYQLGHRFQRMDTKSDACVHFVFAKRKGHTKAQCSDIVELGVLDALSRKSQVMKETANTANVVFPGDHEEWHEDGQGPPRRVPPAIVPRFVPDE